MAAPQLQLLVIVCSLFFVTFGIVAIQLWKGKFLQRCQEPGVTDQCPIWDPTSNGFLPNVTQLCPCTYAEMGCDGKFCDLLADDMNSHGACGPGEECGESSQNPVYGFVSFDNIASAWVVVLQCVTTNSWQSAMHRSMATSGNVSIIYFYACVLLGAYFLLNLFVAVLKEKFAIATSVMKMSATLFDDVDESGDGLLDKEEIKDVFNSKGVILSTEELDQVYAEMDEDGSGEVDGEEFQIWLRADSVLAMQMRARLDVMARSLGADEGGMTQQVLDKINDPDTPTTERARLKLIGMLAGGVDFEELFAFHDRDDSGELNLRQFRMMLRRDAGILPVMMSDDEISQVFAAVDVDSGGGIDGDEFTDWLYGVELLHPEATGVRGLLLNMLQLRHDSIQDMFRRRTLSRKQFAKMLRTDAHHHDEELFGDEKIQETFDAVHKFHKTPNAFGIDCDEFTAWLYGEDEEEEDDEKREDAPDDLAETQVEPEYPLEDAEDEEALPSWRVTLQDIVSHAMFSTLFIILILFNTVCLAYDHHGIAKDEEQWLENANVVVTILFAVELVMKLAALQDTFPDDRFNLFDAFIVVTGLLELSVAANSSSSFRVLRMFRLLRMIRLIAFMKPLRAIFRVIVVTTSSIVYIGVLVSLFMFIFAVCGMQLFGGKFEFEHQDDPVLWHFDTFPIAFMTCFQVLNYDGWDGVMFDGMRSVGWGALFYFIVWIMIGALVLRNLLLVIILETYVMVAETIKNEDAMEAKRLAEDEAALLEADEDEANGTTFEDEISSPSNAKDAADTFEDEETEKGPGPTSSCFCFDPKNGFRKLCMQLSDSHTFELVILSCISLNCITMSLETPDLDPDGDLAKWLWRCGFLFTCIFTLEAAVKMIGYGVAHPLETAYLAVGWNRLDFAILIIAWIDVIAADAGVKALKALRALRAIRILNKIQGLRVLVLALLDALGSLFYVGVLTFMLWLIFGICGVNYLKGMLYSCNDNTGAVAGIDGCVGTNVINFDGQYVVAERDWLNAKANFDNLGNAMYALFEISLGEWYLIAHSAIDSVAENVQPISGYQQWWTVYFIFFVLLSNMFFMNLFVGVIYEKYFARKYEGLEELSKEQRQFLGVLEMISSRAFAPERGPLMGTESQAHAIASSEQLDHGILCAIVLNCIMMALTYHGEPQWWEDTQFWSNQVFTLIFTGEMAVKIVGFTFSQYWIDKWNRFDCFVVLGSWLDLLVTLFDIQFINASLFRIIRIARVIGRIGRLFKGLKLLSGIDAIVNTFISALPALSYIALFIALEIFVFAVIAMNTFGLVQHNGCLNEFRCAGNIM
jgi:Ca2+-binding EF-hand superfamily protein